MEERMSEDNIEEDFIKVTPEDFQTAVQREAARRLRESGVGLGTEGFGNVFHFQEKEPGKDSESQIRWLMVAMTKLEMKGASYGNLQLDTDFNELRKKMSTFTEDARNYANSRIQVYEASLVTSLAGGDVDSFKELGKRAGLMRFAEAMMGRKEIARAFNGFEKRSRSTDLSANPAFANPAQLQTIMEEIVKDIVEKSLIEKSVTDTDPHYKEKYDEEMLIQMNSVKQAELFWRMWMRSGLWNGLVFKEEVDQKIKEELMFLPAGEISKRWKEYEMCVDLDKSFKSDTAEFAVKRLLWAGLFHEANQQGEKTIRPYINYGSKDFLSDFLSASFITNGNNFRDGNAFEEDVSQKTIDGGKVYVKKDIDSSVLERVFIHRNGVFEVDSTLPLGFDASKIKWGVKGETSYVGVFTYQKLSYADKIRDAVMNPGKLARDPFLKSLMDLYGGLENLDSIQKDIEKFLAGNPHVSPEEIAKELQEKRNAGKLYREDLFMMLGTGILKFQMHDLEKKHKMPNITWSQMANAVDGLRVAGMIDDDMARKMKLHLASLDGIPGEQFAGIFLFSSALIYQRSKPGSILTAMMAEFFKQAVPMK